jgi:hypothetical protein
MSCEACVDMGLVPFVETDNPKTAPEIDRDDLCFAICLCPVGQAYRKGTNNGKRVPAFWRVWCAREQIDPSRVFRVEDVYSREQLAAVGLVTQPASLENRRAALLAEGTKRR